VNPLLLWATIGSGLLLLVTVLAGRRWRRRRTDVPRSALDAAVASVGAFLVLVAASLFASDQTRVLIVWLVVLLAVALFCIVFRSRPEVLAEDDASVPQRAEVLPAVVRTLERADYHQVSLVRVAVTLEDAALLTTAFGVGVTGGARAMLARAVVAVVPPDATVWTEDADRVVALVRQEECDLGAWRSQVEAAVASSTPGQVPTVPSSSWRTTSTDDHGYALADLEAEEQG